jgi:tripartite motif-containing protein 71
VAGIRPLHIIYGPGVGDQPLFSNPMGAAFGKNGRVYVADTGNNRIVVFDKNARFLFQFGGIGVAKPGPGGTGSWEPGRMNYPTDVTTDEDGNVYVADFRNDQIQVFDPEGKFLRAFPNRSRKVGRGASGQGGAGIAVTSLCAYDGRVYATDMYQVLVFTAQGKLLKQFGRPGTGAGEFDHPNGIAVTPDLATVVSDSGNARVVCSTATGRQLWSVGRKRSLGTTATGGVFDVPRGLTYVDAESTLVVADGLRSQLVELSLAGKVLDAYGTRGSAPGQFNFPTDVASQGDRLVVAEKGNDRVQVVVLER